MINGILIFILGAIFGIWLGASAIVDGYCEHYLSQNKNQNKEYCQKLDYN